MRLGYIGDIAPLGDAIGRIVAGDDVLLVDLLGQPADGAHPVLERPRADLSRMPARHQVIDMVGAHARRAQMPKPPVVELVGDQRQNALTIVLGGKRAIAIALAQVLEVVVEVTHGVPRVAWAWGSPFIHSIHRATTSFGTAWCQELG